MPSDPAAAADPFDIGGLLNAVGVVQARTPAHLDDAALAHELQVLEVASRRLDARAAHLVAERVHRRERLEIVASQRDGRDPDLASRQAQRQVQRELRDELGWTPAQAKQAANVGRQADGVEAVQDALNTGSLPVRHAAILDDTLQHIDDPGLHDKLQAELIEHAATCDAATFARHCRRVLAAADHVAAERADARRRERRKARMWTTDDGMYALSGQWSGIDAEMLATAVQAFRRPDAAGEGRPAEQITADAIINLAKAALDAAGAPTQHGVRPHVTVTVPWQAIVDGQGLGEGVWGGPVSFLEVRRLLADCGVSRLLVDPNGIPLEAGESVRTVPAGLYRALLARDRTCIGEGCDVPAAWCDVMHLDVPYRFQGRLTLATAGLGCSFHHRKLDHHHWTITWERDRPTLRDPARFSGVPRHEPGPRSAQPRGDPL